MEQGQPEEDGLSKLLGQVQTVLWTDHFQRNVPMLNQLIFVTLTVVQL